MRKSAFLLTILAYSLFVPFLPTAIASDFSQSMIRLSRHSPSSSTGGLICITTPNTDNGVENSFQVIFPTSFTVNQTASNWDIDTSDLPGGAIAWPGISTAIAVSGQTVTFPSSDLSSSTQYCFNFDATSTLTTAGTTGNYPATLRTRDSSNNTIDSLEVGLFVMSNDGISVSATVPANPSDFGAQISLINPSNGSFSQNTELTYRITYSNLLSTAASITVEAEWDLGIIQGTSTPTEDILDYVIGSASNGYNSTSPVVDIVNRKVSWSISSIPANTTNQNVTFRLKTNSTYTSTQPVTFSVNGRVIGPGTQTADSTVTSNYYNSRYVTATPTPTCVPSECPTPTPAPITPTPTTTAVRNDAPKILSVDLRSITSSQAAVFVASNKQVKVKIFYGQSADKLTQVKESEAFATQQVVDLTGLKQKTRYFFRIILTDADRKSVSTDIYVFDTALLSQIPQIFKNSIVITSGDVLLTSYLDLEDDIPNVVIPFQTKYSFRFALSPFENIKSIRALLRSESTLGASSTEPYRETHTVQVAEIKLGQYIGQFEPNLSSGKYKLILQVSDFNGNLSEQAVAGLNIVSPMRVINWKTKTGVEKAKVSFTYYNFRLKKYEPLSTSFTAIKNPTYTDFDGIVNAVLPEGKYRAEIIAIGYSKKSVDFEIGKNSKNYPTVELIELPFSLTNYIEYTFSNVLDVIGLFRDYLDTLKSSVRFLELLTLGVILLFVALSIFQVSRIFGVPVFVLPFLAIYHLLSLFHKPNHSFIVQGKVVGIVSNLPVEGVLLHFSTPRGKVFAHTRSNSNGEFALPVKKTAVKITISKKGFNTFSKVISKEDLTQKLTIAISKNDKPATFGISTIAWYFQSIAESLFESFLVLTIILEVFYAQQFGIVKALPCLTVSTANLLLWALHARPRS